MKPITTTACAMAAGLFTAASAVAMPPDGLPIPEIFVGAPLSGANEVPPVETCGEGAAIAKFKRGVLTFKLNVEDLDDIVAAHFHAGAPGENGPILVTLFEAPPPEPDALRDDDDGHDDDDDFDDDFDDDEDTLAFGAISDDDIDDPDGVTFADGTDFDGSVEGFVRLLNEGLIYVNVHTVANPAGEIRAQMFRAGSGPNPNRGNGDLCDDDKDKDCCCPCDGDDDPATDDCKCDDDDIDDDDRCDCCCKCDDDDHDDGDDSERLRADLNDDGVVNEADLRILLDSFTNADDDDADDDDADDDDKAPRRRGRRGMIPFGG